MEQKTKKLFLSLFFILLFIGFTININAKTNVKPNDKGNKDEIQRDYKRVFDLQKNTVSNIEFLTTNYGIFGLDILNNKGGGFWPRGSMNQYIYGGGIWFAALKFVNNDTLPNMLVEVTYNPNSGASWMVPGRIEDGELIDQTDIKKYRTYFSTDFLQNDGRPINSDEGPKWPIWDSSPNDTDTLKKDRYLGFYIPEPNDREKSVYPKGPAFISGEDIFSTYKDTDLNYFEGGFGIRQPLGYPLKLQFEQMIYSWSFGDYKDFIFIKYDIINKSSDTLWNCWMAPVMDVDIGIKASPNAANDRVKYYDADESLNLALQWTNVEGASGEKGYGFGYLGFDFLESPAVDADGFIRKDKKVFTNSEQLGLKTFKNWSITEDINEDAARYNAMASGVRDGDNGQGDKRFMMATGPFHVLPNDTVRVVIGIILAGPAVRTDADGSDEDAAELVRKDKFAQQVYDNNFRAPMPPDRAIFTKWTPYNGAVKVEWENTSEISNDIYETGLDFLGYRLYRGRRYDLDTFDVDQIVANTKYSRGKGPFGWKQLAQWELPNPFYKSINRAGTDQKDTEMPLIDSLRIVGPVIVNGQTDPSAIKIMRVAKGFILAEPQSWVNQFLAPYLSNGYMVPFIMGIDTALIAKPWGKYFAGKVSQGGYPLFHDPFNPTSHPHYLLDEVSIGTISLNSALLSYNPLFYRKQTITNIDSSSLPDVDLDTIYLKNTIRTININGTYTLAVDRMVPYDIRLAMKDTLHLRAVLDSVYSYIQRGLVKAVKFNPLFEQSEEIRNSVISPYMEEITNHRTFFDVGDDNLDGILDYDSDPTKTEKLINNIDYYYKILSYDEGDYNQPTPRKLNTGDLNQSNVVATIPIAEAAMNPMDFKVTYVDSAKVGGLYNFKMFAVDADRVQQLFAGHEFELEFLPWWSFSQLQFPNTTTQKEFGLYMRHLILKDLNTGDILFNANTFFEQTPCTFPWRGLFTEDASSLVFSDEAITDTITGEIITIGLPYDNSKFIRSGKFTTGEFTQSGYCYSPAFLNDAYGTLGISFDFSMEQRGGRYRPDSTTGIVSGNATTPIAFITDQPSPIREPDKVVTTQQVDFQVVRQEFRGNPDGSYYFAGYGQAVNASFNNGPAEYLVEFLPGGVETMQLNWFYGTKTFDVPYLNVKVTNNVSYKRPGENGEIDVTYPGELQHIFIDIDSLVDPPRLYPDPRNLKSRHDEFIGRYNLSATGFIDARGASPIQISRYLANPADGPRAGLTQTYLGQQGRYYLTGYSQDKVDTVDFTNIFMGSGCYFAFDYARKERRWRTAEWTIDPELKKNYGADFVPGDKALLKTTGGALGFPLPGAKVKFRIDSAVPNIENYTDELLNQINVVPNPYYITKQGQKSAYDAKIYFTRLPKICTIDIYTVTGDLIQSIKHDEYISSDPDKEGVDIWDLLSKNKQRVQSQILVALITTPNGAQTIKKFSVVVGGFRLVE